MRRELFVCGNFKWIDLSNPTNEELTAIGQEFDLHPVMVQDTQDPVHLPKYEKLGAVTFMLYRIYDLKCEEGADTIMSLTRKVGLFFGSDFIVTIHRISPDEFQVFFDRSINEVVYHKTGADVSMNILLTKFLTNSIRTYYTFLEKTEDELDVLETKVISADSPSDLFPHLNFLRRKLSLTKRLMIHTQDIFSRLSPPSEALSPIFQDLRDTVSNLTFLNDELLEDAHALTNLQMSLSTQKNNDVMKVLTVFSVFFMPLTFIVGVYGMNFKHMPELESNLGYPAIWVVMLLVTSLIWWWFQKRGWLKF